MSVFHGPVRAQLALSRGPQVGVCVLWVGRISGSCLSGFKADVRQRAGGWLMLLECFGFRGLVCVRVWFRCRRPGSPRERWCVGSAVAPGHTSSEVHAKPASLAML